MQVLINRNDKLGDFVSSLPCYKLLKSARPDIEITVLVNQVTSELARACQWIDNIIIDKADSNLINDIYKLTATLKKNHFHSTITLFSTTRVGLAVFLARIPYRLAPATKFAQIFYNHRLAQRRSRSEKAEFEYNLDLIRHFLADLGENTAQQPQPPFMEFDTDIINSLKREFCKQFDINPACKLVFLHAGSGGSANNLSLQQYAKLAQHLISTTGHFIVLTAGPNELKMVENLSTMIREIPHVILHSTQGLVKFSQHIAFADLFISGSTGPLHIAGALNVPTAAFYTRRRSATSLRWQTLNTPDRRLSYSPPPNAREEDMTMIDIEAAAREISEHFLQHKALSVPL